MTTQPGQSPEQRAEQVPAVQPSAVRLTHEVREVAEGFGDNADQYDRARPSYPADLIARIHRTRFPPTTSERPLSLTVPREDS